MRFFFWPFLLMSLFCSAQDSIFIPKNLFPLFEDCYEDEEDLVRVQDLLGRAVFGINKKWEGIDSTNINLNYYFKPDDAVAPTEFRVKFLASKNLEEITNEIIGSTDQRGKSIEYITVFGSKSIIVHDSTNFFCCEFPFFVKSLFVPLGKDLVVFNFSCQNQGGDCLCQFKQILESIRLVPTLDEVDSLNLPSFEYSLSDNQELRSLNDEIRKKLDLIAPFLLENPNLKIDVGVHHVNKDYLTLSTRGSMTLAHSIVYYLQEKGIKNIMIPVAYGDSEPKDSSLYSPKNNRVEFEILRK